MNVKTRTAEKSMEIRDKDKSNKCFVKKIYKNSLKKSSKKIF